jgi:hypothetical protein
VKREPGFAHGVAACETPCLAHSTRGTSARGGRSGTGRRRTSDRRRRRSHHRRCHRGSRAVRPMRLMSDSVLHFSDNRRRAGCRRTRGVDAAVAVAHAAKVRAGRITAKAVRVG